MECYLCDRIMINKSEENLTNNNKNEILMEEEPTYYHKEHIIQNGLGGTLKNENILCESCGKILGEKIDSPFIEIFEVFASRLNIKKDRETNKRHSGVFISDNQILNQIKVVWESGKIAPAKPLEEYIKDVPKVIIYGNYKASKNYIKNIKKKYPDIEIEIKDDIQDLGYTIFNFNMKNDIFKRGLGKIAIEYALHCGIDKRNVKGINSKERTINSNLKIIPYYPYGIIEKYIEKTRKHIDSEYPYHALILFTIPYKENMKKKLLVCFVELFSTFQHYVIINDEYEGENIYKTYGQKILKKDVQKYYQYLDASDLDIGLKEIGITWDEYWEIYKECEKFNQENEDKKKYWWDILDKMRDIKKYEFDYNNHIDNLISGFCTNTLNIKAGIKRLIPEEADRVLEEFNKYMENDIENYMEYKKNIEMFYSIDEEGIETCKHENFRKLFYDKIGIQNYITSIR